MPNSIYRLTHKIHASLVNMGPTVIGAVTELMSKVKRGQISVFLVLKKESGTV